MAAAGFPAGVGQPAIDVKEPDGIGNADPYRGPVRCGCRRHGRDRRGHGGRHGVVLQRQRHQGTLERGRQDHPRGHWPVGAGLGDADPHGQEGAAEAPNALVALADEDEPAWHGSRRVVVVHRAPVLDVVGRPRDREAAGDLERDPRVAAAEGDED